MSLVLYDERKSLAFFILLLFITVALISYTQEFPALLGGLGLVWGIFGLFRLLYITSFQDQDGQGNKDNQGNSTSKILNLPSQLIFSLGSHQFKKNTAILKRLAQWDVLFFLGGSIYFILWVMFCSFYPADISVIKDFNLKQGVLLDFPVGYRTDMYVIATSLSSYGILGVVIFTALSYSQSHTNMRWVLFTIFPVFVVGVILMMFALPMSNPILWPDMGVFKGGGIGQASILEMLSGDAMRSSGTGIIHRFIEVGSVGLVGVYVLFIPAFVLMVRALFDKKRTFFKYMVGLLVLLALFIIDVFWLSSVLFDGLTILGVVIISMCWGSAGRRI